MPDGNCDIERLVKRQKAFFNTGRTKQLEFRQAQLARLLAMITENEHAIIDALHRDMGKPPVEAYASEIGMLCAEINFVRKRLARWIRPKKVSTMLFHLPARSHIVHEPYGVTGIIGPWNYPFQLVLSPLTGALAAGNCAIIKPSEYAGHSSSLLAELIPAYFDPDAVSVVTGDAHCAARLARQPLDYLFFTGGSETGRKVLAAAADNLTPCTLELGGKNICIVEADADIPKTARRIVWGKFFNAGQTCVAPDYVMVAHEIEDRLKQELAAAVQSMYGAADTDYTRIITTRHFDRLVALMKGCTVFHGGGHDRETRWIEPTLIASPDENDPIMTGEIFGPLLPVTGYTDLDTVLAALKEKPKPLAAYLFSRDAHTIDHVIETVGAGSMCINGTFSQVISCTLPFGGVGKSGMGTYHGRYSFETFSHSKGVLKRSFAFDPGIFYPPYKTKLSIVKKTMRLLFKHL